MAFNYQRIVQNELLKVIRTGCSECSDLTPSSLAPSLFVCGGVGDPMTTYRATLVNPLSTTTASHLVGVIQNWVSQKPSFYLNTNLVNVEADCPTAISSLVEENCSFSLPPEPDEIVSQTVNTCEAVDIGSGKEFTCNLWLHHQPDL